MGSHLVVAAPPVPVAAVEYSDEIAFLVLAVLRVRGARGVGVERVLRNEGELGEDRAVPSIIKCQ
jgi:hypothetical protein